MSDYQNFQQLETGGIDLDVTRVKSTGAPLTIHEGGKGGTQVATMVDGQLSFESRGVEEFSPANQPSSLEGILGTGRQLAGNVINSMSEIRSSTRFNVNGMEVTADSLVHLGELVKNADGSYGLPAKGAEAAAEDAPSEEPYNDHLSSNAKGFLGYLDGKLGSQSSTDSAIATGIGLLANNDVAGAVRELSQRTGESPAQCEEYVRGFVADVRGTVSERLKSQYGITDPEACLMWAEQSMSPSARASLGLELYTGSTASFKKLASDYIRFMENAVVADRMGYSKK